jgi:hypothetical protein
MGAHVIHATPRRSPVVRTRLPVTNWAATWAAALATVAALGGLSACGTELSPDVHPGRAAVIEDGDDVTFDQVDELAGRLCTWQEPVLKQNKVVWPMAYVRSIAVDTLVVDQLVRRFGEDRGYDTQVAETYAKDRAVEQLTDPNDTSAKPDPNALEYVTYVELQRTIEKAAGAQELGSTASEDEAQTKGAELFRDFRKDVDVDIDPRFGTIDPVTFAFTAPVGSLSVPVGDTLADAADAGAFDQEYAGSLPPAQRCG